MVLRNTLGNTYSRQNRQNCHQISKPKKMEWNWKVRKLHVAHGVAWWFRLASPKKCQASQSPFRLWPKRLTCPSSDRHYINLYRHAWTIVGLATTYQHRMICQNLVMRRMRMRLTRSVWSVNASAPSLEAPSALELRIAFAKFFNTQNSSFSTRLFWPSIGLQNDKEL